MSHAYARSRPARRIRSWRRRVGREFGYSDGPALTLLVLLTLAITLLGLWRPDVVPFVALLLPMFIGNLYLGPRTLPWFVVLTLAAVCLLLIAQPSISAHTVVRILVTFAIGFLILLTSFRRSRLGVSAPRGESMFVDLRDRIRKQGRIPALPDEWYVEAVTRSAEGTSFSGDF
ncbi:MAG: serine/threonine-protein phosphatase, partial [Actinomycetota bacterium]|nr:serine/threonine-protein phosphatase [Actinomycetota bacterium]